MRLYDFHTHLNDPKLYPKWQEYLNNFVQNWWKWLVNVWVDAIWNQRAVEIANYVKNDDILNKDVLVFSTIGYHPSEICFWNIKKTDFVKHILKLKELYLKNKDVIVWIWECWIDIYYPNWTETLDLQKEFFGLQCELAQELNLPLVIHSRDDFNSTFDILKNFKNLKIYFHCWWYWPEEVKKVLNYFPNVWIWFAWNVTYPKADKLRDSLKVVPFENLVLETDAPYLAPQVIRWQKNEPANVRFIYEFVSDFRSIEIEKICDIMEWNFKKLYNTTTDNFW